MKDYEKRQKKLDKNKVNKNKQIYNQKYIRKILYQKKSNVIL